MRTRVLTGITPSGTPHLGNFVGAIRPSVEASTRAEVDAFFFLADYHALIKCEDPALVNRSRLEIAATWLAAGLDPERVTFYRQSDVPEVPELCWILTCVTGKGLMNRAHAYKAAVDQNQANGLEADHGVTMGLFSYPVLMAADILLFNAHQVPVGRDQIQHLEMARDIAQSFNHLYGGGQEIFTLPEAVVDDEVATLPGLDGRKMSKSYRNTIPLFDGGAQHLRRTVGRIVTDSRGPGEPKDASSSNLHPIYRAFSTPAQLAEFEQALRDGMSWDQAKQELVARIETVIGPMRERYEELMAHPERIEDILQDGAVKARKYSVPLMKTVRDAVGLGGAGVKAKAQARKRDSRRPRFVSFRDSDALFRFRLLAADGEELLLSAGHADPKAAGAVIRQLQENAGEGLEPVGDNALTVVIDGVPVASAGGFASAEERDRASERIREALQQLAEG